MSGRNIGAIVAAAVVHFLFGAVWFTVLMNPWMAAIGKTQEQLMAQGSPAVAYTVAFICNLLIGYAIFRVLTWRGNISACNGAMVGLLLGLLIAGATIVTEMVFEAAPLKAMAIIAGYPIIGLILMGLVIGAIAKVEAKTAA